MIFLPLTNTKYLPHFPFVQLLVQTSLTCHSHHWKTSAELLTLMPPYISTIQYITQPSATYTSDTFHTTVLLLWHYYGLVMCRKTAGKYHLVLVNKTRLSYIRNYTWLSSVFALWINFIMDTSILVPWHSSLTTVT